MAVLREKGSPSNSEPVQVSLCVYPFHRMLKIEKSRCVSDELRDLIRVTASTSRNTCWFMLLSESPFCCQVSG